MRFVGGEGRADGGREGGREKDAARGLVEKRRGGEMALQVGERERGYC